MERIGLGADEIVQLIPVKVLQILILDHTRTVGEKVKRTRRRRETISIEKRRDRGDKSAGVSGHYDV
jgi:hypothetical protein